MFSCGPASSQTFLSTVGITNKFLAVSRTHAVPNKRAIDNNNQARHLASYIFSMLREAKKTAAVYGYVTLGPNIRLMR